jgi:hypothetical protein
MRLRSDDASSPTTHFSFSRGAMDEVFRMTKHIQEEDE